MAVFAGPVRPGYSESIFRSTGKDVWQAPRQAAAPIAPQSQSSPAPSFDIGAEIENRKRQEEERVRALQAQQRAEISKAWEPIFAELDRQIGTLPGQKAGYEEQVGTLATSQKAGAEASRVQGVQTLEGAKTQEETRAKTSIRDLEQDIRNQLEAKATYFGNLGAGDSSAVGRASEAVTKSGLKAKSTILSGRDEAISTIDAKIGDVNNLATEQNRKIDEWKSTKLFEISETFNNQVNQLNMAKANASAEKQKAISDIIFGLEQQLMSKLGQLDDAVVNYKSSIATWQQQRAAELEDYGKKLAMSATYSGGSDNQYKYNTAVSTFNSLVDQGLDSASAQAAVKAQMGIDPLAGLQLTPEQMGKIKGKPTLQDEIAQILGGVNSSSTAPTTGQGFIPDNIPLLGGL